MNEVITITDGFTLNPGDLSWSGISSFGQMHYYDRTAESEVAARCEHSTIVVTNKTPINAETIALCKSLKVIAVTATGYNIVDIAAATQRKIHVCNVPGYGTDSVAQHAFALILELTNHTGMNAASVASGEWSDCPDFSFTKSPITELRDKTIGIVGFGEIGKKVAEIAQAFGMKVIYSRSKTSKDPNARSVEEIFSESDIVSLHCPLTKENAGFVNKDLLSRMKKTAWLINTARGQLVDEIALAAALRNGSIRGAGLDVLSKEPPPHDHPLVGIGNCIITPHNAWYSSHNAWYSFEARTRIMQTTVANIKGILEGRPQHVVNQ
jgi:glycerate dehydrogenase